MVRWGICKGLDVGFELQIYTCMHMHMHVSDLKPMSQAACDDFNKKMYRHGPGVSTGLCGLHHVSAITEEGKLEGLIVIAVISLFAYFGWIKPHQNWLSWPTLEQYWSQHPDCRTNNGVKCYNCGSRSTRHYGWKERADKRRIHKCNQCSTVLYRTEG
jgi:hypothetical protein